MSMVDDMAMFNSYPLRREVFDVTFNSLWSKNLIVKYLERFKKPTKKQLSAIKETYTLVGFPFAFQVSYIYLCNFV